MSALNCGAFTSRLFLAGLLLAAAQAPAAEDGAALYKQHCAGCHDSGAVKIPTRATLKLLPRVQIIETLVSGVMAAQAAGLTVQEKTALANFLSEQPLEEKPPLPPPSAMCTSKPPKMDLSASSWNGWGGSLTNDRNQPRSEIRADDVPRLKLKWAFGFPSESTAAIQPVIIGQWVLLGSDAGRMYALDLRQGCVRWTFDFGPPGRFRSAVTIQRVGNTNEYAAYFTDGHNHAFSLNAETGKLRWKYTIDSPESTSSPSATPKMYGNRMFISMRGQHSADPECCKHHGAVAALDMDTGRTLWLTNTIREPVIPIRINYKGVQLWGPSGVSVWTTPTVDAKRRRIYVGTGDSSSDPAASTSDSILALDMDTGTIVWHHQFTFGDASCDLPDKRDCPVSNGPDFDFQQPPILVNVSKGQRLLVAGQKSGIVYGIDPDDGGREVWRLRVGSGGPLGGVNWGSAVDGDVMYVAVSDHVELGDVTNTKLNPNAGGLVAIRLKDGKQLWRTNVSACEERPDCSKAQSAPVTAIPGVVFSGSLDGHMRAYAMRDGHVLWDFDTARDFQTTNGVSGRGGSIDVGGPAVAGGIVLTTSGYPQWGGMPGNVLLAFSIDGR